MIQADITMVRVAELQRKMMHKRDELADRLVYSNNSDESRINREVINHYEMFIQELAIIVDQSES